MQRWLSRVLVSLVLSGACSAAIAQRAIPEDNLAYAVLITIGNGYGSGFFINAKSGDVIRGTAKHVLFDPATNRLSDPHVTLLSYSKDTSDPTPNRMMLDMNTLQANGNVKAHSTEDVAVI